MNKTLRTVLFVVLIIGVAILFAVVKKPSSRLSKVAQNSRIDQDIALSFSGMDILTQKEITLSHYREKLIIITFWATWCPPCRAEIPHFIDIQKELKDTVQVIGVSVETNQPDRVRDFAEKHGINYPIIMATKKIIRDYGNIRSIPTTFMVDRTGRIVQKYVGFRKKEVFMQNIKSLMSNM